MTRSVCCQLFFSTTVPYCGLSAKALWFGQAVDNAKRFVKQGVPEHGGESRGLPGVVPVRTKVHVASVSHVQLLGKDASKA